MASILHVPPEVYAGILLNANTNSNSRAAMIQAGVAVWCHLEILARANANPEMRAVYQQYAEMQLRGLAFP